VAEFTTYPGDGPASAAEDSAVTLGLKLIVDSPSWLVGYRFWRAAGGVADPADAGALWVATAPGEGTPVADTALVFPAPGDPGEWQEARLPVAVPLTPGTEYTAGVHVGGGFSVTAGYWSSGPGAGGVTSGPFTAPNVTGATGGEQNSYSYGPTIAYPSSAAPGGGAYYVDVIVSDTDPAAEVREVTADFALALDVAAAAAKTAAATVSLTLDLTASATAAKSGTVTADFSLPLTVAASATASEADDQARLICSAWATMADLPDNRPDLPTLTWEELLLTASQILWALSGRQWSGSGCTATARFNDVKPCWPPHRGAWADGWSAQILPSAQPDGMSVLKLPHDEVTSVLSVTVDGGAGPAWYLRGAMLVRDDGRPWAGDVRVTYRWGLQPPPGGVAAAVALAVELARARAGDSACRLPKRVTNVVRQGVSVTLQDPMQYMKDGLTGVTEIDQWIVSVNPARRAERASAWSPDIANSWPM
jgi:hypothetical protein